MTASNHCRDNQADREKGKFWEEQFCRLAAQSGKSFSPLQIGRKSSAAAYSKRSGKWNKFTLPDIVVWTHPGEHHEIKHKNPTKNGKFGLEVYRFNALLWFAMETKQDVLYTIHDWSLANGKHDETLAIEHWRTARILDLNERWSYETDKHPSYINGRRQPRVPQYFWSIGHWRPLGEYWKEVFINALQEKVSKAARRS